MSVDKRQALLKLARNSEEKTFAARYLDQIRAVVTGRKFATLTGFLDPGQTALLEEICRGHGGVHVLYWGGYPEAERRRALLLAEDNYWHDEDCRVDILQVVPLGQDKLPGHRDYLGSLMGLGISRDRVGDIVCQVEGAAVFVAGEIMPYLLQNLQKVGRCPVVVQSIDCTKFSYSPPELLKKVVTAASQRLDVLVSKAFNLSRSESALLVQQGKVFQNWRQQNSPSRLVVYGDVITCRGYGRFRVLEHIGVTKKGREKYVLGFYHD
ncbi:MAG: YlmH/Sll1252 family protein [Desulfotomaculaceae bacterium]|nr:YlmH/Sll1252 family protein [Desulfotomaculaceae bacterium]